MKPKIDYIGMIVPFSMITIFCISLVVFPQRTKEVVDFLYHIVTDKFGWLYLWMTLISFILCIYLALGKYGNIKLGEGKKEFSEFSWAAMIFCASMAAGFLYWTNVEWIYYYIKPPLGMEPLSAQAMEYAGAYPLFHWGPSAWCLYLIPGIAFAYSFYNKKAENFDIASPCIGFVKEKYRGGIRKVFNIVFIIGMIGGAGTTLGIGTPVTSAAINALFGIEDSGILKFTILCMVTLIFTISTYLGVKKGMRVLSTLSIVFLLSIVLLVFLFSNQEFIIRMASTSLGLLMTEFFRMSTWMDPINQTGFVESWTVFYWAWWLSIALSVGLFIAKISRGRTIREVILGCLGYGLPMTFLFFSVLGGNSMDLYLSNKIDLVSQLNEGSGAEAVIQIFNQHPLGILILVLVLLASIILTATTYDSVSHTLAMVTTKKITKDGEPSKKLRVFWALAIAAIPGIMMLSGGTLEEIQTLTIIFTLPVCFIYIFIGISLFKLLKEDTKKS